MKSKIFLFALASVLVFGGVSAPFAQESDEYAECTQLLNSPPLDTLLTQNDGDDFGQDDRFGQVGRFGQIGSDHLGEVLLGVKCSRTQIIAYFLSAGWEFTGESHIYGESGPSSNRYKRDNSLGFCKPRKLPWRLFFTHCGASSGFYLFEGRITHINAFGAK